MSKPTQTVQLENGCIYDFRVIHACDYGGEWVEYEGHPEVCPSCESGQGIIHSLRRRLKWVCRDQDHGCAYDRRPVEGDKCDCEGMM